MKLIKNKLIAICCLLSMVPLHGDMLSKLSSTMQNLNAAIVRKNNKYSELDKFKEMYRCPADVKQTVDSLQLLSKDKDSVSTKNSGLGHNKNIKILSINGVRYFDKGPGVARIINAQKLKKYLEDERLNDLFGIAEESIYQQESDFTVLSKEVKLGNQNQKISLPELQGMIKIAENTGYWDWQIGDNLLRDKDGKLIFIDTEDIGFHTGLGAMKSSYMIDRIKFLCLAYKNKISNEALNWAQKKYNLNLNASLVYPASSDEIAKYGSVQCLLQNKAYNGVVPLNVDKLKKEFRRLQRDKKPIQEQ
ncbi:hypothetical protein KBC04_02295 [Candidatus Babeliales bacterium]|nr:hypothetical protein [Candidatus Babeliales bacterium]MBP9843760.1 hypothetical protein [Candidatus Babeliales bacterium]